MAEKRTPERRPRRNGTEGQGLLGIGLDGSDGHKRVTTGADFLIVGGSSETHEIMQDLVIRMEEKLKLRGKRMRDLERDEFDDLVSESFEG